VSFFRDFFTEILPVFVGIAGKNPLARLTAEGRARAAWLRWLAPSAQSPYNGEILHDNLYVAATRHPTISPPAVLDDPCVP